MVDTQARTTGPLAYKVDPRIPTPVYSQDDGGDPASLDASFVRAGDILFVATCTLNGAAPGYPSQGTGVPWTSLVYADEYSDDYIDISHKVAGPHEPATYDYLDGGASILVAFRPQRLKDWTFRDSGRHADTTVMPTLTDVKAGSLVVGFRWSVATSYPGNHPSFHGGLRFAAGSRESNSQVPSLCCMYAPVFERQDMGGGSLSYWSAGSASWQGSYICAFEPG
jgi:hypothetical protein